MMPEEITCPECGGPLGPVLKGAYKHFPDSRFCAKCIRFVEVPQQEVQERSSEKDRS